MFNKLNKSSIIYTELRRDFEFTIFKACAYQWNSIFIIHLRVNIASPDLYLFLSVPPSWINFILFSIFLHHQRGSRRLSVKRKIPDSS